MLDAPTLRIVPLERIRRHEEFDPLRVERLRQRLAEDRIQVNPMVCTEAPTGELVLLDGATRTSALRELGLPHAVVQIVYPDQLELGTWHHVVRGAPTEKTLQRLRDAEGISMSANGETPSVHLPDDRRFSISPDGVSSNTALNVMVHTYLGHDVVSRVTNPSFEIVASRFPDWSMIVEFPTLTIEDVMRAGVDGDHLPAGITRFKVEGRALRVNVDMTFLEEDASTENKQARLDAMLEQRAASGRFRRYEETVFILDD